MSVIANLGAVKKNCVPCFIRCPYREFVLASKPSSRIILPVPFLRVHDTRLIIEFLKFAVNQCFHHHKCILRVVYQDVNRESGLLANGRLLERLIPESVIYPRGVEPAVPERIERVWPVVNVCDFWNHFVKLYGRA